MNYRTALTAALTAALLTGAVAAQAKGPKGHGPDFSAMDANSDTVITRAEFDQHAAARFLAADADDSGDVTLEEMEAQMAARVDDEGRKGKRRLRGLKRAFAHLDADENGVLTLEEYQANARTGKMFDRLDADGNGEISAAELDARKGRKHHHGHGQGMTNPKG